MIIEEATANTPFVTMATLEDISGVLDVQDGVLHTNNKKPERGFLWYPLDAGELEEIIANPNNHVLMVAKDGDNVEGYFLGYDLEEWRKHKPDWFGLLHVPEEIKERIKTEKVFYGRHLAVANQRSGIGSVLNRSLQQVAHDRGYTMLLIEIMKKPILNTASISHNLKQGYQEVGSISYSDGTEWGVFINDLAN